MAEQRRAVVLPGWKFEARLLSAVTSHVAANSFKASRRCRRRGRTAAHEKLSLSCSIAQSRW